MKRGLLIIMSGPSGVGKGTVRLELMKDESLDLFYSVSMTTRSPRPGERNGVEYYFTTKEDFDRQIKEGNLLEYAEFVGNKYGTPKDKVNSKRDEGVISIFLVPPSLEELEARIRGRSTETEEVIQKRLRTFQEEVVYKDQYQYIVVNDDLNKCVEEIRQIIKSKM